AKPLGSLARSSLPPEVIPMELVILLAVVGVLVVALIVGLVVSGRRRGPAVDDLTRDELARREPPVAPPEPGDVRLRDRQGVEAPLDSDLADPTVAAPPRDQEAPPSTAVESQAPVEVEPPRAPLSTFDRFRLR